MAQRKFRIHLLDMGDRDYGDCIVVEVGATKVLIDGGHPGDERSRRGFRSLPEQMASILGRQPPFTFDLLVVTHCHNDHIGCLPELVAEDIVRAKWALVADPDLGWGIEPDDGSDPFDADNETLRMVLAGLREEPPLRLSDDELAQFLADAVKLSTRYRKMLTALSDRGTKVVRCGRDAIPPLINEFRSAGFLYLGPTEAHLAQCANVITEIGRDSRDALADEFAGDAPQDAVAVYRSLMETGADSEDRRGIGAALNNQSIVIAFSVDGKKALLTGDMQFAEPEMAGLDAEMEELRGRVEALEPYQFYKIGHHGSYNAFDESVLEELGETRYFGISAGRGDIGHPARSVLNLLKAHRDDIVWVRTDRNGLITVDLSGPQPDIRVQRGSVNNTRLNSDVRPAESGGEKEPKVEHPPIRQVSTERLPEPAVQTTPTASVSPPAGDYVHVTTKVPHVSTRVTVTIDVEPRSSTGAVTTAPTTTTPPALTDVGFQLAGGRQLPKLLFVTSREKLAQNIGTETVARVISAITQAGHHLVQSLPPDVSSAAAIVQGRLAQHSDVQGVVLLGGYDVVPPQKFDTLDPQLRAQLHGSVADGDNFIVWRDAIYGDSDGDADQELPVSRIPDGQSKELVLAALQAFPPASAGAYGIRNLRRPFAQEIWQRLSTAALPSSEPLVTANVDASDVAEAGRLYFMLHGDDDDTTRFWGESAAGGYPEAFHISCVPASAPAVLLTGCCWGALTSLASAYRHVDRQPITGHTPASSLSLAFLRAGALAFVGCTGSHYSPIIAPYGYFGGPLHDAFWRSVLPAPAGSGLAPAAALFEAKKSYIAGMPHGQTSPKAIAIEMKILHQFHCLGLGW
jgi:beta-lactamase superfamily II metal-dependent hydrolase